MKKENAPDNEKLRDDDIKSDEQIPTDITSSKDDEASVDNVKGNDLNKSKKGHVTDLNEKIVKTERRIEDMNKSIMGHGIFDF